MNEKNMAARWAGKVNHAQGAAFESRLEAAFAFARMKGLANIRKNNEPMKPIKDMGGGKYVAVYTQKSNIDYSGELIGGRSAAFEAKYTTTDRIDQSRVTVDQTSTMNEHADYGAECWVLCGFRSGKVYKIPWAVWLDMKGRFGRKYVTEDDLKPWTCPVGRSGIPEIISTETRHMTDRPEQKDTLAIADSMAQLVRLATMANGMNRQKTFSIAYSGAKWVELKCFDQASGKTEFIVERDTPVTVDTLEKAVDKMRGIIVEICR